MPRRAIAGYSTSVLHRWMDGWVDGWLVGWMDHIGCGNNRIGVVTMYTKNFRLLHHHKITQSSSCKGPQKSDGIWETKCGLLVQEETNSSNRKLFFKRVYLKTNIMEKWKHAAQERANWSLLKYVFSSIEVFMGEKGYWQESNRVRC